MEKPAPPASPGSKRNRAVTICMSHTRAHGRSEPLSFVSLKKLESQISLSVTHWHMGDHGWIFIGGQDELFAEPVCQADYVYQIYQAADPDYTGSASVPILWDKQNNTIVSNESADIIRMFNSAFDDVGAAEGDYYPEN